MDKCREQRQDIDVKTHKLIESVPSLKVRKKEM